MNGCTLSLDYTLLVAALARLYDESRQSKGDGVDCFILISVANIVPLLYSSVYRQIHIST